MRSFAVWHSLKDGEQNSNSEAEIHVNLWDKGKKDAKRYCFDFGFLIEDISSIEKIYLYCPFQLEKNQISDLGSVLLSDNKLVNAIFNENFTTTNGKPKKLIVNGTKDKSSFIIYALEIDTQIDLQSCKRDSDTPGTIVEIKIKDIDFLEYKKHYFRIRIEVPCDGIRFINDQIRGVSLFNSHFTNTEIIDFRLNDIRSCSDQLRERFNKGEKFKLRAVHYLILRNANDVIIHHGQNLNSRMLEDDLWRKYIGDLKFDMIAYHFKRKAIQKQTEKEYIDDFSVLTRFQYEKETLKYIAIYILVILILAIIANGISCKLFGS